MKKQVKFLLVLLFLQCLTVTTLLAQPGLIAYYPFSGNANDETGNGYNGTVSGATLSDDRFGNPTNAYSFDGINDKIVIGKEPNFPSWNTYAVSLWFLNDGGGDQGQGYGQKILSKAQYNTDFHLGVLNDGSQGRLSWWSAQGGFNSVDATNQDYRDSKWHHVVLNKNSPSNGDIWVDGVLQNSSNTLEAVFNSEDLVIGFTTHSDGYQRKHWSGKIDDIRIYNGVLSPSEISDLFTEGGYCPGPSKIEGQKRDLCSGGNFDYTANKYIPGATYTWSVPAGCTILSGQGTDTISINIPVGFINGEISVTACTGTVTDTLSTKPEPPLEVTGPALVTPGQTGLVYSVVAEPGVNYYWNVHTDAQIVLGQGTNSVTVNWGTEHGLIQVKAFKCGDSSHQGLHVKFKSPGLEYMTAITSNKNSGSQFSVYPNPATNNSTVVFSTKKQSKYIIEVTDVAGKVLLRKEGVSATGKNTITIDVSKYSKGVYFISLTDNENGKRSLKLSKE